MAQSKHPIIVVLMYNNQKDESSWVTSSIANRLLVAEPTVWEEILPTEATYQYHKERAPKYSQYCTERS